MNTPLVPTLKSAEFNNVRRRRTTIGRNVLVITQIALSMILLVATDMLKAGFRKTLTLDPKFHTDHLMMMSLNTSHVQYTADQTRNFYHNLVDDAHALPNTASVTLTSAIPLDHGFSSAETLVPKGYQFPQGQETATATTTVMNEHYFATMKTDIIHKQTFTSDDNTSSHRVAIINKQFALTYWPGQEPIGKRIRLTNSNAMVKVIKLTPTEKYRSIVEPPRSFLYLPFAQHVKPTMSLLIETTTADKTGLAPTMRELVRSLNADQPISNLRTFASFYRQQAIAAPLLLMQTTATMGLLRLTLALVNLYGVVAYSVARRTRKIDIRMAISAARSDVLMMILRQELKLAVAGVLVNGTASLAFARLLTAETANIGAANPATYVIVPIALIGLTIVASYFPTRRAARINPLLALRYE